MIFKSQYATFIISFRMKKQVRKVPTRQSDDFASGDHELGLRVLARIIARVHVRRITKKLEGKDELFKGDPSP
jgi:hypothetical protein